MKPAARPELAQALTDLELDIGTELRRIHSLASIALRAAEVKDRPLEPEHLLSVVMAIAQLAEMTDNDLPCAVDVVRRAAGLEVLP